MVEEFLAFVNSRQGRNGRTGNYPAHLDADSEESRELGLAKGRWSPCRLRICKSPNNYHGNPVPSHPATVTGEGSA
ncbi:MAG: hypothetical protein MRJ92_10450 [Nitrospira sp.]|nr:hypothetical protein [Nitrospira sp.]